jgi:rod shape-determining protein MreC
MFSRKTVVIAGLIFFVAVNIVFLTISSKPQDSPYKSSAKLAAGIEQIVLYLISPFQKAVSGVIGFFKGLWRHYFFLVHTAKENDLLKRSLNIAMEKNNQCVETELSNLRFRTFLNFQKTMTEQVLAAEIIGRDPSPWFKTLIIDKGSADGVRKGLPVVVPEGITGQIVAVSTHFSKVLLIVDQNSAVDGLVQRTRARGIIKGSGVQSCRFDYALSKYDIQEGDTVVSSGLDGVFPKGLRIGSVTKVIRKSSGIFQDVSIMPFVDFEKIEEVLVVLSHRKYEFNLGS